MSKSKTRLLYFATKGTVMVGAASFLLLLSSPDAVSHVKELLFLLPLVLGFFVGFMWFHGRLDHFHSETERNESKVAVYTQSSFFVYRSKRNLVVLPFLGLIVVLYTLFSVREAYYTTLKVLSVIIFMCWIGVTLAILFWERRRHLHVYMRKIEPRKWAINFTSTDKPNNI